MNAGTATVTKDGVASTLSAIAVGDMVMIEGTISGTSVTATSIHDGMGGGKGRGDMMGERGPKGAMMTLQGNGQPVVGGTVTSVTGSTLSITNKSNATFSVDATSATIMKAGATSTIASVVVGDEVIVQGTINGSAVTASSVIDQGVKMTPPQPTQTSGTIGGTTSAAPAPHNGFMGGIGGFFRNLFGFF